MLGTSPNTKGGVASVIRVYQSAGFCDKWPITYLVTHEDGGSTRKLKTALIAWCSYALWLVRRRNFVLHIHSASRASFWRKVSFIFPALWCRKPIIFHLHGGEFMQFYEQESSAVAKNIVRFILDRCTHIVVLTEGWRRSIESITKNRSIVVIANPALSSRVANNFEERDPESLLFLGRVGKPKGIYVLLDALSIVRQHHPNVRLVCGGDGEIDEVRRAAASYGLSNHVELLGWVDDRCRARLFATGSIFVLPSFAEGLPMSILEAMSAGLPVVSTRVGGIPEVIADGVEGFLVPTGDAKALSGVIAQLLDDSELRRAMGLRARATFCSKFDANVVLPKLEDLYRQLGVLPVEPN